MVCRPQPVCYHVRRALQRVTVSETRMGRPRYTEFMTLPANIETHVSQKKHTRRSTQEEVHKMMEQLAEQLQLGESLTSVVSIWAVLFGLLISAALSTCIGFTYRHVNSETTYSQSLVHTLVILAMITSLIMAVVGSNIARAFSLVGALSIIRFRTAVKSPYDVTFIFFAIAVGMACGTRFYAAATISTLTICFTMLTMKYTNFGAASAQQEYLLTAVFDKEVDYESAISPLLGRFFQAYNVAYSQTLTEGDEREVIYSVKIRPGVMDQEIVDAIRAINDDKRVSFRTIRHAVDIP